MARHVLGLPYAVLSKSLPKQANILIYPLDSPPLHIALTNEASRSRNDSIALLAETCRHSCIF